MNLTVRFFKDTKIWIGNNPRAKVAELEKGLKEGEEITAECFGK